MIELYFSNHASDDLLSFAVVVARSDGKWVLCKHKGRNTYECPGGHREKGENIEETARRELYEETGALQYDLMPICGYSIKGFDGIIQYDKVMYGMLYYAQIHVFGDLPNLEIESVSQFEKLPIDWTYPEIQPRLFEKVITLFDL